MESFLFHDANPDTKTYHSKQMNKQKHFRPIPFCTALNIKMLVNQIYSKSNLLSPSGIYFSYAKMVQYSVINIFIISSCPRRNTFHQNVILYLKRHLLYATSIPN